MARPRQGIDAYYDIRPIWFAAFTTTSISRTFHSEREAIQLVQRLNNLRLLWRQKEDTNAIIADKYMVRRESNKVIVEMRAQHPVELWQDDTTNKPIDKQMVLNQMVQNDMLELEQTGFVVPKQQEFDDPFDPDAPLALEC
jgi:hypothetical protein